MSLRIPIIGDSLSGKSTLAAHIANLLGKLRGIKATPHVVLTQPTTAYVPYDLDVKRTRTLSRMLCCLEEAEAPIVLDDLSEFYALLVESWREQSGEHRDRAGLPRKARMSPDEWNIINQKYRSVYRAGARLKVDLIEVHRRGPVMVVDTDFGMVEGEGIKARGQAEAGGGGDLVLLLDGGLKSRYRETGSRVLRVISDASGRLVGRDLSLPRIRCKADRAELDRELGKFLRPSLVDLIQWSDSEADAWERADAAPADNWAEAKEAAQKAEGGVVMGTVKALLEIEGLAGQSGEARQKRAALLFQHFGVGDVDSLAEVPAENLRVQLPSFEEAVRGRRTAA